MFENITKFFKKFGKNEKENSKNTAKERLHLVLAQDRANISADFLEMMKQEIIEVIKKYIDIDEEAIDVRMTNKPGEDGTLGAPALYANIPIVTIKNEARKLEGKGEEEKADEIEEKNANSEAGETNKELKEEKNENEEKKTEEIESEKENKEKKVEKIESEKENEEEKTEDNSEEIEKAEAEKVEIEHDKKETKKKK